MSTARLVCLSLLLSLAAATTQAERFEVWEDSGNIWGRDNSTGKEWKLNQGTNCHSPYVDGRLAIWIADFAFPADVMMYRMTGTAPSWPVFVGPEIASDPRISDIGNVDGDRAYAAWKMNGGIWAMRLMDFAPPAVEVVPNYTGPYTLEGHTLSWDGGSMELWFPTPPVPEPDTLLMLCLAVVCLCVFHRRPKVRVRPRIPSGP